MSVSQFLAPGRFPAGTVLSLYKSPDPTRRPAGATVATPTMTATGVTVTGLEPVTAYVVGAVIGGVWQASAFRTGGEVGMDAGDIGSNNGNTTGQIKLTTLGVTGKAFLRFGTAGSDEFDMAGFWLEDAGTLKTNSVISANSGVTTPVLDFGEGTVISGDGTNFVTGAGAKINGPVGFNGAAALAKPAITGSRAGNAALASLLTTLATYGLITNSTTA